MGVFSGQYLDIKASEWNRMLRSSRELPQWRTPGKRSNFALQPNFVWVKNDCGELRNQFEVLKVDKPVILPTLNSDDFRRQVLFSGIEPTANCQFAVLLHPACAGDIVPAAITGDVQCEIDITTSLPICFKVGVRAGEYKLRQLATGSAEAIWSEDGTGSKWAHIKLAQHREVLCKSVAPILKGTFGECVVHWGDYPSESPAGESIVGINRFGHIGGEKWLIATWLLNHWYIKAAEC